MLLVLFFSSLAIASTMDFGSTAGTEVAAIELTPTVEQAASEPKTTPAGGPEATNGQAKATSLAKPVRVSSAQKKKQKTARGEPARPSSPATAPPTPRVVNAGPSSGGGDDCPSASRSHAAPAPVPAPISAAPAPAPAAADDDGAAPAPVPAPVPAGDPDDEQRCPAPAPEPPDDDDDGGGGDDDDDDDAGGEDGGGGDDGDD